MFSAALLLLMGQVEIDATVNEQQKIRYEAFRRAATGYDIRLDGEKNESFKMVRVPFQR